MNSGNDRAGRDVCTDLAIPDHGAISWRGAAALLLAVVGLHPSTAGAADSMPPAAPAATSPDPAAPAAVAQTATTPASTAPGMLAAGAPPTAARTTAPAPAPPPKRQLILGGSLRVRQEYWDWFGPQPEGRYTYTGSLLRVGATYLTPKHELALELAQPTLLNLPTDATLPGPLGQLGQGPSYRDANTSQEASLFVKQAYWRVKGVTGPGSNARLGRFEFVEGAEVMPKDPSLAWLKRERIAHRLIGTFGFTHVGRSFDGGQYVHTSPDQNVTLFAGMPTEGVFDLDGGTTLDDIKVGYASVTRAYRWKGFQGEGRLFGIYYLDDREGVVKTDNRPLPERRADTQEVSIGTFGGHAIGLWEMPTGKVDALLWAAGQVGGFGSLSHSAFSGAAELGFQPKGTVWNPWIRAGFFHASGDKDPGDGSHETFFPILPTPRIYARFPFFTLANLNDAFAQVIVKPHPKLTLRGDVHGLWLADDSDLWYLGGGAFQRPTFGYGGRPSRGKRSLATLVDLSADYQWRKNTTFSGYLGYAWGGDVIDRIYGGGSTGLLGYLEVTQKF